MRRACSRAFVCLAILIGPAQGAFALNPALDINQYSHTAWKVRDGFSSATIKCIAQTSDGYLWLGTESGLLRFDGVRAVQWQPPSGQPLPSEDIWSLLASRDGALWVGTAKGLVRWKNGQLTRYPDLGDRIIGRLLQDHKETVWVSAMGVPAGRLCAIGAADITCYGDDGRLGYGIWALHEDPRGNLWLGVTDGVWRWAPGEPRFFSMPGEGDRIQGFAEDRDGELLLTVRTGVRRFLDGRTEPSDVSKFDPSFVASGLLRDRDGALWIATGHGLVHARDGKTDTFAQPDGLSGDVVEAVFEDREGNIWVITTEGLDRFRDVVVSSVSEKQGLSGLAAAVRAGVNGTIWISTAAGLANWNGGHFTWYLGRSQPGVPGNASQIIVAGLPAGGFGPVFVDRRGRTWVGSASAFGYVEGKRFVAVDAPVRALRSIAEDSSGTLWLADQKAGLVRLSPSGEVSQISWAAIGHKDFATVVTIDPARGGLWLGFWDGGIGRFQDGQMRETYSTQDGLGSGRITNMRFAPDGSLWVATQGGLSRLSNHAVTTLTRRNGLPCDSLHWFMPEDAGSLWMDTPCGIMRVARSDLEAWIADARHSIKPTVFDSYDGVRIQSLPSGFEPYVAKSADGRLWFAGPTSLNILDPRRLNINPLRPPVDVERMLVDHKDVGVQPGDSQIHLPALTRDIQIDYTALSLVAPEKIQFRYMLEGHDRDWQDVGNRRQAFYSNLRPRSYRFRVIASNNSGVWNEAGAFVDFSVAPAYYQTWWFLALSVGSGIALVWGAYRLRLSMVENYQREISALNERLMRAQEQERIRIAGELHDGVMQQMLAVTMMLGTTKRKIAGDSDAKAMIDKVQDKLVKVGTEIRQLSHDLLPPMLQEEGLPQALRAYCDEFSGSLGTPVTCEVDDSARDLSRGSALALFRIAQEALGNATKHGHAKHIVVRLTRSDGSVLLSVSDDGVGFDRNRLASGSGLGLVMMRERANQLNGTFDFESAPGRGTTISVTIPFR